MNWQRLLRHGTLIIYVNDCPLAALDLVNCKVTCNSLESRLIISTFCTNHLDQPFALITLNFVSAKDVLQPFGIFLPNLDTWVKIYQPTMSEFISVFYRLEDPIIIDRYNILMVTLQ